MSLNIWDQIMRALFRLDCVIPLQWQWTNKITLERSAIEHA